MEIHHYTSIENLALILKNKTIRLQDLIRLMIAKKQDYPVKISNLVIILSCHVGPIVKRKVFLYGKCMLVKRCTE